MSLVTSHLFANENHRYCVRWPRAGNIIIPGMQVTGLKFTASSIRFRRAATVIYATVMKAVCGKKRQLLRAIK